MKFLCIVVARGGSKGIPGKNLKLVGGKPLLQWVVEAAQSSHIINNIILSTDSSEIQALGQKLGLSVSALRPAHLATDTAKVVDVLKYELEKYEGKADYVLLLQPTSPLVTGGDIDKAIEIVNNKKPDTLICVHPNTHAALNLIYTKVPSGGFQPLYPDKQDLRRQDIAATYVRNGLLYMFSASLLREGKLYGIKTEALEVSEEKALCIDNPIDLEIAEFFLTRRPSNG
jgi:CMP-N,N'-diacetyllegionaminic acid synthase